MVARADTEGPTWYYDLDRGLSSKSCLLTPLRPHIVICNQSQPSRVILNTLSRLEKTMRNIELIGEVYNFVHSVAIESLREIEHRMSVYLIGSKRHSPAVLI